MSKPSDALAKAAARFKNFSLKKKFAAVAGAAGATLLAADMLVIPAVMAPHLERRLDDAIRADNAPKVEEVLHAHYAPGMWGKNSLSDAGSNSEKEFLAPRLVAATQGHDYAALEALLKNDVAPFSLSGTRSDDLFFFVTHDVTYENADWRNATVGAALKNADTKALDIWSAHGFKADQAEDNLTPVLNSKELIAYYIKNPDHIAFSAGDRYSYSYNRSAPTLLSFLIANGAPVDNVLFAIDQGADVQGSKDGQAYENQPLYAAISRSADAGTQQDALKILDALLKHGASPNADVHDPSGYEYSRSNALMVSLRHGSPESTRMLVQAGAEVDETLRTLIRDNVDPSKLKGWDASAQAAANDKTREVLSVAAQQRALLEKLQKKAPTP